MGSMCHSFPINRWDIRKKALFKVNQEPAVEVVVGDWDDWGSGGPITIWMHKKVLEKLQHYEYLYVATPYADEAIRVFDRKCQEIDLINDRPIKELSDAERAMSLVDNFLKGHWPAELLDTIRKALDAMSE